MTIKPGDKLPEASFKVKTEDGMKDLSTADIFSAKKVVLIGVPGAFTPTCSNNHLPGYLENYDAILSKGVDTVAVVSVNDPHVMAAWANFTGGQGKVVFLADGSATFAKALGLDIDLTAAGLGVRSKRFSMIVEDGVVQTLHIEPSPGQAEETGAAKLLTEL
jgi:peroxiredoxin